MTTSRFATRLNSFGSAPQLFWPDLQRKPTMLQMVERAATVKGLTDVDLNFPDHVSEAPKVLGQRIRDLGLSINGLAMRYYTHPGFKRGAFTNPEKSVRREAIELTKRGIDAARAMGAPLMTIWLGQDGFDYNFQLDYGQAWELGNRGHPRGCRARSRVPDQHRVQAGRASRAKPAARRGDDPAGDPDAGAPNLGVTMDFAHSLYAGEQPAFAAHLIDRRAKLLGVHLNDAYAKRDDGLMVGAVHLRSTLELLRQIRQDGYDGALYFDTFPDAERPRSGGRMRSQHRHGRSPARGRRRLDGDNRLGEALERQDAVASQKNCQRSLDRQQLIDGRAPDANIRPIHGGTPCLFA